MPVWEYSNYEEYKRIQTETNKRKIDVVWCKENHIKKIWEYIKNSNKSCSKIICHGTRNGAELEFFSKYFKPSVIIGTEISDTACNFKNTIQWDFHQVKPEWLDYFDILYSNALDHSYKPEECIDSWMSCVNKNGVMIIDWNKYSFKSTITDPFSASFQELENMLSKKYKILHKIQIKDVRQTRLYIVGHK